LRTDTDDTLVSSLFGTPARDATLNFKPLVREPEDIFAAGTWLANVGATIDDNIEGRPVRFGS